MSLEVTYDELMQQLETLQRSINERLDDLHRAETENEQLRKRITLLLNAVGMPGACSSSNCRADILWVVHTNGRRAPYDADGQNHFITCPDREMFKQRRKS